jgi:hypothetical protein
VTAPAPAPSRRWGVGLALLAALALALRVPFLGALPNPAGDEGNWTSFGLDLLDGRAPRMAPDARFVSTLFAHLIALSYRLLGVSFAGARAVLVAGLVASLVAVALVARRLALPRAGLALAALLAVHPWSVLWSRTATVPYALALGLAVLGPLLTLLAARTGSALAVVLAGQCLALGVHFTPLALLPCLAALLWLLSSPHRALLRRPAAWASAALASLHLVAVLLGAAAVAGQRHVEPARWVVRLGARLHVFALTVLGGYTGESTLRHFTGGPVARPLEWALGLAAVALLAVALRPAARAPAAAALVSFARIHGAVALVGLPALLATARTWNLPAIDAERYLFATLAPALLCLGALAEDRSARARLLPFAVALYLLVGPTQRAARFFLRGGSPDAGFYTLAHGGGYRGWKGARERVAVADLLRREVDRLRGARPALVVVSDYAFHPLMFTSQRGGSWCTDVAKDPLPDRPGHLHVFVTWSDGLFGPTFGPPEELLHHRALRDLMRSGRFRDLRRRRVYVQPDGSPLLEVWTAERVETPLLRGT